MQLHPFWGGALVGHGSFVFGLGFTPGVAPGQSPCRVTLATCVILNLVVPLFKISKAHSTLRSSRAVPHPSTNRALCRLTSEVRRDPVHSTRYGREHQLVLICQQAAKPCAFCTWAVIVQHVFFARPNFAGSYVQHTCKLVLPCKDMPEVEPCSWRGVLRSLTNCFWRAECKVGDSL